MPTRCARPSPRAACLDNCANEYLPEHGVKILVASRALRAGDELTHSYINEFGADRRQFMLDKWGFACVCAACSDGALDRKLRRLHALDDELGAHMGSARFDEGLRCGREMLVLYDELHEGPRLYAQLYYDLFQLAVTRRATLAASAAYIRQALENRLLFRGDPADEECVRFRELIQDPTAHPCYLAGEPRAAPGRSGARR